MAYRNYPDVRWLLRLSAAAALLYDSFALLVTTSLLSGWSELDPTPQEHLAYNLYGFAVLGCLMLAVLMLCGYRRLPVLIVVVAATGGMLGVGSLLRDDVGALVAQVGIVVGAGAAYITVGRPLPRPTRAPDSRQGQSSLTGDTRPRRANRKT